MDLRSELSLQTNEWPKIRTVGGELAIKKNKTQKKKFESKKAVNLTTHTCKQKCKKLTKQSKEKTQSNIHKKHVTYKDKWSKRKVFRGIKLIKLTANEKTRLSPPSR